MIDVAKAFGDVLADIATHSTKRALDIDPRIGDQLRALEGNTIELNCNMPPIAWHLTISNGSIKLGHGVAEQPQVIVRGNLADLASWMMPNTRSGNIEIEGDETLLAEFLDIVRSFEPDLQQPLSQFIGPQAASTLLGTAELGLKGLQSLIEGVGRATQNNDSKNFVQQNQLDSILSGIDDLRLRVDRLSAEVHEAKVKEAKDKEAETNEQKDNNS